MANDGDCVKVAVRIRPLVKSELDRGCQSIIEKVPGEPQIVAQTKDAYTFNFVFSPDDTQKNLYESSVAGMLQKLFAGYNVTILAYGQTGSGKTHTMGTTFNGNFDENMGVIPRAVQDIFDRAYEMSREYTISVTCSFVELYQEQLYDLLSDGPREQSVVDIREDGHRGIVIPGLTEHKVTSVKQTTDFLIKGSSGRAVGATAMNSQSSRSHAIFTLNIHMIKGGDTNSSTSSKFHLVDLAGSERAQKTKATGDRFKEGVKINQGLLALGNVISALGTSQNTGYVGYRDSKLTRLLQDSLGGNSVTLMIACVSPADYNMDETISTLRYADRARKIKNKPIINQDPKAAEINRLNAIIQKLNLELLGKGGGTGDSIVTDKEMEIMRKNVDNLIEKNRNLQQQLQNTLNDVAEIEMRAIVAETAYDELQNKLTETKELFVDLNKDLNEETCSNELLECAKKLTAIRKLFGDIDDVVEKSRVELLDNKKSLSLSTANLTQITDVGTEVVQQKLEAFTSKQIDFNNELRRINRELCLKEELHQKMTGNHSKLCTYEADGAETKMKEYEDMIQILEAEKTELLQKLKCVKENVSAKIAEDRRQRLQQLERDISDFRKKNLQQAKLLKMREKETEKIENLNKQIQEMKASKVSLLRAMKAESANFRQWKLNREKELIQLKEKDKKRRNEMVKMESLHNKQKTVLKRKVEEAMAVNKRLKDALEKQKSAQAYRKQNNAGKVEHIVSWVNQELEVIMSVIDAEHSLDQLMEDRATITARYNEMKNSDVKDTKEINSIEKELQMRNAQINDLQQKIVASDVETKLKSICEGLQSMPEARAVLKRLFTAVMDLKREYASMENKISEYKSACEVADERVTGLQQEMEVIKEKHKEERSCIEKSYEDKISVLLRELSTVPQITNGEITPEMEERIKITQEALDKVDTLREELENYKKKYSDLQAEKLNKNRKNYLRPKFENDDSDDIYEYNLNDTADYGEDNPILDPDWRKTPNIRTRNSNNSSREVSTKFKKRSADPTIRCKCSLDCSTKRCRCRKNDTRCSENCKCFDNCANRPKDDDENDSAMENQNSLQLTGEEDESITPKKAKLSCEEDNKFDITTPRYPYADKKRKPFFDNNVIPD